ncbi:hypothetical protein [Boseongicola aestuarii]|uniref:Uncharacterized protein n=1 Tax=Boseongicola aestuarii TaxID=1470561 RepID=A0A238J213_9RHOB|nr:hypothetical protein [Boseongicola aestuarii]SMX24706.1 hypothetical protein BOA8489_02833 [Boseongicola aestuarii]
MTMATELQRAANKKNAAKSTGPKSKHGKRRSAQNARAHGLTQPPDAAHVQRWYRTIMNDPTAELQDAFSSEEARAALALAEAEAHLERTRDAEQAHLEKMVSIALQRGRRSLLELAMVPESDKMEDDDVLDLLIKNYSRSDMEKSEREFFVRSLKIFKSANPNRRAELSRRMLKFRGYRKRAEGHRNRVSTEWLKVSKA